MNDKKFYEKVSIGSYTGFSKSSLLYMIVFFVVLSPQIILLFATKTYASLLIVLCTVLGAACSEYKSFFEKKHILFYIVYSLLTGTLVGFYLPATFPPVAAFFLTFLFMLTAKSIFGRQGISWINPVAFTLAAAWFVGHFYFPGFQIEKMDLLAKNPSLSFIQNSIVLNSFDERITSFFNNRIFSKFNVAIPNGYVSFFWDNQAVIPAFRFSILTLTASLFLFAFDFQNGTVPFIYLVVYSLLVKFLSPVLTGGVPYSGDMLLALLSSGTLFTTFFLLQWHGTMPYSIFGKILYAFFGGIIAFVFCGTGTSPIGAIITILFLNLLTPTIVLYENKANVKKLSLLMGGNN